MQDIFKTPFSFVTETSTCEQINAANMLCYNITQNYRPEPTSFMQAKLSL